jgi:isocitrate dehydrogenase
MILPKYQRKAPAKKELEGVDLFVHWSGENPNELAEKVKKITDNNLQLSMITNRGIKVWPEGFKETFCADHWRCRFKPVEGNIISKEQIINTLKNAVENDVDVIKTENLYRFNGVSAYSLGQGQ